MLRTVLETLKSQVREQTKVLASLRAVCLQQEAEIAKKVEHIDSLKKVLFDMGDESAKPRSKKSAPAASISSVTETPVTTTAPSDNDSKAKRIRDAAKVILKQAGKPMTQRAIKEKMDEMGIVLDDEKPVETIRIYLNRAKSEFRHLKDQGYVVVDEG